ncbi:MAG: M1 family metallopeptidase [Saprospiraceae bacterium]|nr:M1 family metallopeptidase [Saprospiraceae bacterium]
MMRIHFLAIFLAIQLFGNLYSQQSFTRKDSLRGALRPERAYNVLFYDLDIKFDISAQSIEGILEMEYIPSENLKKLQLDLFENMEVVKVLKGGRELKHHREFDALFIETADSKGSKEKIKVYYKGKPIKAKNAPWDGGFVWKKDENGQPWVGVACEGTGASLWWPNKDHLSDEPDKGMKIRLTVPEELMAISNGNLETVSPSEKGFKTWIWKVSYPINNYNVSFYIGDYIHISDKYQSKDSTWLDLDYYVLKGNESKAKAHFEQVHKMLESYEHYFEKYPFWNDGFALVESPYLGMEHQSAIAYGNKFQRGYLGGLIPEEFNFDFIIIHESGHEYFGNAVSVSDHADMWIHEGFTTYMEALYLEYLYDKKAALRYLDHQRKLIKNNSPIVGPKDVNYSGFPDSDQYYKGSWMLQTLRFALKNDAQWFKLIKEFYTTYKFKNIQTEDFINFVNKFTGKDFHPFFNVYLYKSEIPSVQLRVEYSGTKTRIFYKLNCSESKLEMPIEINLDGKIIQLDANTSERNIEFNRVFKNVKAVNHQALVNIP